MDTSPRKRKTNAEIAEMARQGRLKAKTSAAPVHILIGLFFAAATWWLLTSGLGLGLRGAGFSGGGSAMRGGGYLIMFSMMTGYVAAGLLIPSVLRIAGVWKPQWDRFLPGLNGELADFLKLRTNSRF